MRSHLLQVLDDDQVGIHETVDAVLHAGLFTSVQLACGDLACDALAEADVCEGVDCYDFDQQMSRCGTTSWRVTKKGEKWTREGRGMHVRTLLDARLLCLVDDELLKVLLFGV